MHRPRHDPGAEGAQGQERYDQTYIGGLHPLPRMRDRARAGAVRRVRLRRRQVRSQSRARGVRARRHGRSQAAGGAEVSRPVRRSLEHERAGLRPLRSARLHFAGDHHGLRRRRQDRRPACAAAVFASRRCDRQLHLSPHPAERGADQGGHRLHVDEGPGRRRARGSRGSQQVRRVPQVRRALQVRPVLRVRLVLRVHKAHLVLPVRSGRPARTV